MESRAPSDRPGQRWLWAPLVLLAACLPTLLAGSGDGNSFASALGVGLISDDGPALGYVHREGPWADWFGSEYDLRTVRFWRPLVTTTLGLQERLTGVDPAPLRLFNLAGHALAALCAGALAWRLGGGGLGALVSGVLVGLFPAQGGNVLWPVGRVDAQCVPLVLLALVLCLDGRRWSAALCQLGALATKELAVVTPVLALGLLWLRGERSPARLLRGVAPLIAITTLGIVWRRLALGVWVGGYPSLGPGPAFDPLACVTALGQGFGGALVLGAVAIAVWAVDRSRVGRSGGAPLDRGLRSAPPMLACLALVAAAPLAHVLLTGEVPLEHRRTFFLADALLAVAFGTALGLPLVSPSSSGISNLRWVALAVAAGAASFRAAGASEDLGRWAAGGALAEETVARARAALEGVEPSDRPVLLPDPPRTVDGAYVLHWGVADRFRAPFPETPRPVWPWRPMFVLPGATREPLAPSEGSNERHVLGESRTVAALEVRRPGAPDEPLVVGSELVAEPGPTLAVAVPSGAAPETLRWEVLLVTELGYGHGLWSPTHGEGLDLALGLRELLLLTSAPEGGIALWQVLAQAADLGARRGYVELRALGAGGTPLAVGPWIELLWSDAVRDELLPR